MTKKGRSAVLSLHLRICAVNSSGESLCLDKIRYLIESESTRSIISQNAFQVTEGILPNPISCLYKGRRKFDDNVDGDLSHSIGHSDRGSPVSEFLGFCLLFVHPCRCPLTEEI
jgi:hypothetical protein